MSSSRNSLLPIFLILTLLVGPFFLLTTIPRAHAATVSFQGENWTSDSCTNAVISSQITGIAPNQVYSSSFDPTDLATGRECLDILRVSECAWFYECNESFTFSFNYGDWVLTSAMTGALANTTIIGSNVGAGIVLNFSQTHQDNFEARLAVDPSGITPFRYTAFDYGNTVLGQTVGCMEYLRIFTNVDYQVVIQHTNGTAFDIWFGSEDLNEPLEQFCNYGRFSPAFPANSWPVRSIGDSDGSIFIGPIDMPDTGTATGEINLMIKDFVYEAASDGTGLNEDAYNANLFKAGSFFGRSVITDAVTGSACGSTTKTFNANNSRLFNSIRPPVGFSVGCTLEAKTWDTSFLESVQGLNIARNIITPQGAISSGISWGDVSPAFTFPITDYRLQGFFLEGPSGEPDITLTEDAVYARVNGTVAGGAHSFIDNVYFEGNPIGIFENDGHLNLGALFEIDLQGQIDAQKGYMGLSQMIKEPRAVDHSFRLIGDSVLTQSLGNREIEMWVFYSGTVPGEVVEGPQGENTLTPIFSRSVRAGPNATGVSCPSGSFSFVGNNSFTLDSFAADQGVVGGCQNSYVTWDVSSFEENTKVRSAKLQFDEITNCNNPRRDFVIVPVTIDNNTALPAETVYNHIQRPFALANPYATPNPCSETIQSQGFFTLSISEFGDASRDITTAIETDGLFSLGVTWFLDRFIDNKSAIIDLTLIVDITIGLEESPPNPFGEGLNPSILIIFPRDQDLNLRGQFAASETVTMKAALYHGNLSAVQPDPLQFRLPDQIINFWSFDENAEEFRYRTTCTTDEEGECTVNFLMDCCFSLIGQQVVTWRANYTGSAALGFNTTATISNEQDLTLIPEGEIPLSIETVLSQPFFRDLDGNSRSTFTHFEPWTIRVFLNQPTQSRNGFEVLDPLPMQTIRFEMQVNGAEEFTLIERVETDVNGLAETTVRAFDERFTGIQRVRATFFASAPYKNVQSEIIEVFVLSSAADLTLTLRAERTSLEPGEEAILTGELFVTLGDNPAEPVPDIPIFLFFTDDRDLSGSFFLLNLPSMVSPVVSDSNGVYNFAFQTNLQTPRVITIFANATINSILVQSDSINIAVSDDVRRDPGDFGEPQLPGLEIFVPNEDFGIGVEGSNFLIWLIQALGLSLGIPLAILLGIQKKGGTTDMSWLFVLTTGIFFAMTGWGVVSGLLPIWVPVGIAILLSLMIYGTVRGGRGGGTV